MRRGEGPCGALLKRLRLQLFVVVCVLSPGHSGADDDDDDDDDEEEEEEEGEEEDRGR